MTEQPKINSGILKEKELLEKLSLEISSDFSISEKLAKKLIYKTHLSLSELKDEIYLDQEKNEKIEYRENFDDNKLEKLFFSISGAREIIENASKSEIEELKKILENNNIIDEDSEIIKKIFGQKLIYKAKNPNNASDHIMGVSLGITISTIILSEFLYDIGRGIITSIPDFIDIINGTGEIDSLKKV